MNDYSLLLALGLIGFAAYLWVIHWIGCRDVEQCEELLKRTRDQQEEQ